MCTPEGQRTLTWTIDIPSRREMDLLFVINDSPSMVEEQVSLAENFPRFIEKLTGIQGGLPNIHIGVTSTNLGGNADIDNCEGVGDSGSLQSDFVGADPACRDGSITLSGAFIEDVVINDDTGERSRNYEGIDEAPEDLSQVFSCMAQLGVDGCAFPQPLQAMRHALQNGRNNGFLREDAYLAVVFITDEDDCSAFESTMFGTQDVDRDSLLGPLNTFRCFEFGVQCSPDQPREPGEKFDCTPRSDSPFMVHVDEYVQFLKSLKSNPEKIIVAGILGEDAATTNGRQVFVEEVTDPNVGPIPALRPGCTSETGKAIPPVRLRYFLDQFPDRNSLVSVCDRDMSSALDIVGELLGAVLKNPFCLDRSVRLPEGGENYWHDCVVVERLKGVERILPYCSSLENPVGDACWFIRENQVGCEIAPFQELVVAGDQPLDDDAEVVISCRPPAVDAAVTP